MPLVCYTRFVMSNDVLKENTQEMRTTQYMDDPLYENKTDLDLVLMSLEAPFHFRAIIDRYASKLQRYIMRISNVSNEEAEDLLQDTFIKAYANLNGYDTNLSLSTWLYRIARNITIDHHRKTKVRPQGNSIDLDHDFINNVAGDFELNAEIDQTLLEDHLSKVLELMDFKYKEVLILRYWQEKSYDEISDIIKKPPGTVATLISRAKKQLAKLLQEEIKEGIQL